MNKFKYEMVYSLAGEDMRRTSLTAPFSIVSDGCFSILMLDQKQMGRGGPEKGGRDGGRERKKGGKEGGREG